ncbi:MAG: hypothetical protein RMY64_05465 [Nostoc sp. DedQUE08]|nr:hypothetical protein [Nostoc sp. DedQUE07]MDZ8065077.1 hypothetical protein [Nostoc sp. DedQUE08]MDZ8127263.1 hypothetical protein [Nostoc sp. DedQUE07]
MSICTIKVFTAFQASSGIEQRDYIFNSKFLDWKLSDAYGGLRLRNAKIPKMA